MACQPSAHTQPNSNARAMNPQTGSPLVTVPLEILVNITKSVNTRDFGNVRLTCRVLERQLLNFFCHEFFRKKQFMLMKASMEALVDISKHAVLSSCLTHLIIATDHLRSPNPELVTGEIRNLLAEALSRLKNLQTVNIRDFNNYSRRREGIHHPWRSYGHTLVSRHSYLRQISWGNGHSGQSIEADQFVSTVFALMLAALAISGARPPNLEVTLRHHNWALRDSAFHMSRSLKPKITNFLAHLQKLLLALDFAHRQSKLTQGEELGHELERFLARTKRLEWLRLNFSVHHVSPATPEPQEVGFLTWLAEPAPDQPAPRPDRLPPAISFHQLRRLELGQVEVTPDLITDLHDKFPTLQTLGLWKMAMTDTSRVGVRPNLWKKLFLRLAMKPGQLHRIEVGHCSQMVDKVLSGQVFFGTEKENSYGSEASRVRRYSGRVFAAVLERLAAETYFRPKHEDDQLDSEDGDGSSEEDSETGFSSEDG